MTTRKLVLFSLLCVTIICFSGCTESRHINANDTIVDNMSSECEKDTNIKVSDGISGHDNSISYDDLESFKTYIADNDEYRLESLIKLFAQEPVIEEMDSEKNGIAYRLKSTDGSFGYLNYNCVNYYSPNGLALANLINSLTGDYDTLEELTFCSSDEVIKNSIITLKSLGINGELCLKDIISMDIDSYTNYSNKIIDALDEEDEKEAAKIQLYNDVIPCDFYYISFNLTLNNIPIMDDDELYRKQFQSSVYGSSISVCYSSNGIEYLYVSLTEHAVQEENTQSLKYTNADMVVSLVTQKLNQLIIDDNCSIESIDKIYIYVIENGTGLLLPCWKCSILLEKSQSYICLYFKALDGSEIF